MRRDEITQKPEIAANSLIDSGTNLTVNWYEEEESNSSRERIFGLQGWESRDLDDDRETKGTRNENGASPFYTGILFSWLPMIGATIDPTGPIYIGSDIFSILGRFEGRWDPSTR